MSRITFAVPMLFAASLAAQVPPTPPSAPAPRSAPLPALAPLPVSRPSMFEPAWANELVYNTQSLVNTIDMANLNYQIATDFHLDAVHSLSTSINSMPYLSFGSGDPHPVAWAQSDPADSLYRMARDQFSRGDYRRAADLFRSLPTKFPSSAYVADAQYYQAFALYRIGGTPELQAALAVLEARKTDTHNVTRTNTTTFNGFGNGTDAAGLAARIAKVLSTQGMSNDPAVKRALAAGGNSCDQEDQSVRAEALSALMQNDAEQGRQAAMRILGNKDECSVPLRRNALMLVGNKYDDGSVPTLIAAAKSDPSYSVRSAAVDYLVRVQNDAAINAVIDLARNDTSKQIQRKAVSALAQSTNPRARSEIRTIVENNAADESLRSSVIDGMNSERMTADDATWLRGLYTRTTSPRIKQQIVSVVGRAGGDANNQWLLALLKNEDEPLESRSAALRRAGTTMDVATLVKSYDASSARPMRETIMQLLSERKEPAALDKIVDIAKNGTDTRMRTQAIGILSRSKDPRAAALLLQLVDH